MITFSPDHNTILLFVFSLTSKTGIHHLDPADGARIALHVPAPHGHRVPLLEREHFVAARLGACTPGVRGQGAGLLAVFHVGHGGGAEPARRRWVGEGPRLWRLRGAARQATAPPAGSRPPRRRRRGPPAIGRRGPVTSPYASARPPFPRLLHGGGRLEG